MKKTGMKYRLICLFIVISLCVFPATAEQAEDLSVTSGSHSVDASKSVLGSQQLVDNVASAFLYETKTDTLMYAWNPDAKMFPSSLVKIMTAYIAVEKGNLADSVTVRRDVIDTVPIDAVSSELQEDEVLSLEDLLYCMMVDSANDAAAVIADYISGSQDAFVALMNQYAQDLGCNATQFMNVHGLHHAEQYTTARDMCRILRAALKNEYFVEIFSTVNHTVAATNKSEERAMTTGNFLMSKPDGMEIYFDERVTGGRTGVAEDGGRCLAACAQSNGLQLISIVMGSKSVYEKDGYSVRSYGGFKETSALLDVGFDGYKTAQILYDGQVLAHRPVVNGSNHVVLGVRESASTVLPENISFSDLSFKYTDLTAQISSPVEAGETLSHVQIWYGNLCVGQADLIAMNTVKPMEVQNPQVSDPGSADYLPVIITIIVIILGCLALVFATVYIRRKLHSAAAKKRSQRYRRYRRRSR